MKDVSSTCYGNYLVILAFRRFFFLFITTLAFFYSKGFINLKDNGFYMMSIYGYLFGMNLLDFHFQFSFLI